MQPQSALGSTVVNTCSGIPVPTPHHLTPQVPLCAILRAKCTRQGGLRFGVGGAAEDTRLVLLVLCPAQMPRSVGPSQWSFSH